MDHGLRRPQEGEIELSGLSPRLSPRDRARRLAIGLATVLLALALVLSSVPALRDDALALLIAPTPSPTRASLSGASSFYFLPTAPWVTVLVDGRPLSTVPLADAHAQPLRLARGLHHFEWRGAPFQSLRCALPVPVPFIYTPHGSDACLIRSYFGSPPGYVLQQRESLATLPPQQQNALQAAIAAGLSAASASADIQPGEAYLAPKTGASSDDPIAMAGAPLRATLHFILDLTSQWSEPCEESSGIVQPCRFPDQDCRQLCTTTQPGSAVPSGADPSAWYTAVPVQPSWTFSAPDGTIVGSGPGGVGTYEALAQLRITWDGTSWHATPLFGHIAGGPVADDTVCASARDWLASGGGPPGGVFTGPLVPGGPALTGEVGGDIYASGPDPTDGCFASVPPAAFAFAPDPPITQSATFLLRFGVLVAVNAVARQIAPDLPVADVHEQAIAQRLQAQVSGAG